MQLTIHIPDDLLEAVETRLPSRTTGILESIALDAVLGFLSRLAADAEPVADGDRT